MDTATNKMHEVLHVSTKFGVYSPLNFKQIYTRLCKIKTGHLYEQLKHVLWPQVKLQVNLSYVYFGVKHCLYRVIENRSSSINRQEVIITAITRLMLTKQQKLPGNL